MADPVTDLRAEAGWASVVLAWVNPDGAVLVGVRRTQGEEPAADPDDGTGVPLSRPDADSVLDTPLEPETTYTYTLWAQDAQGGLSDPVAVTVATGPAPPPEAVAAQEQADALAIALATALAVVLLSPDAEGPGLTDRILDILEPHYRDQYPGTGDADEDSAWLDFAEQISGSLDLLEPDGTQEQVDRVAQMTAQAIINHATQAAATASGQEGAKQWWTMRDNRVRMTHRPLHGHTVGLREKFPVGPNAVGLDYPGQPVGDPELWINCRCILTFTPAVTASASEVTMSDQDVDLDSPTDEELDAIQEDDFDDDDLTIPVTIPWHGVLAPEGEWSGDGRMFSENALTWRDFPLPLKWQKLDADGHSQSFVVGNIQDAWRDEHGLIHGMGDFSDHDAIDELIGLICEGSVSGLSIDADSAELAETDHDGEEGYEFTAGRISGATIVPIPAFDQSYIALGTHPGLAASGGQELKDYTPEQRKEKAESGEAMDDGSYPIADCQDLRNAVQAIGRAKDPEAVKRHIKKRASALDCPDFELPDGWAADTQEFKRGPGWVTDPEETRRLHAYWTQPGHKGYASIKWGTPGDFRRLRRALAKYIDPLYLNRVATQWHYDALGYWPGECGKPGNPPCGKSRGKALSADAAPVLTLAAAATQDNPYPYEWFTDPQFDEPTPLTIDGRRVFGHLALWGTCHIGISGACITPPASAVNYSLFRLGAVPTDKGLVSVGHITMDTGHAGVNLSARAAIAHYDDTGTVVADIAVGEDDHGIWFAGALKDGVTDGQVHTLQAGTISGDWRDERGALELRAALLVNVPGFPIPRPALAASGGRQVSLVAAGMLDKVQSPVPIGELVDEVIQEIKRRDAVAAKLKTAKDAVNAERVRALLASVGGG